MNASRPLDLREMTHADVDAGLRLCRQSHWNQIARDWRQFLDLTPGGAAVAVDGTGGVIGSVATMRYAAAQHESGKVTGRHSDVALELARRPSMVEGSAGLSQPGVPEPSEDENCGSADRGSGTGRRESGIAEGSGPARWDSGPLPAPMDGLAWIAMVLVDPARRGGGVGTALLRDALERTSDVTTVGLDATPLGQPLYASLGFHPDARLVRLHRANTAAANGGGGPDSGTASLPDGIRPATLADLEAIATLDASVTGLDRREMLAWLFDGAPGLAWVHEAAEGIDGVVLGRPGHNASQLGPLMAASGVVALDLVRMCVAHNASSAFFIDVADDRPGWRESVEALGFQVQRPFTRMYRGEWRPAGDATRLFAVIGPEFG